ncbi:berberine bridge enzyme-like 4 [Quercus robur]|uniref:berberine bridge enzyme-like 4 n=1 Tax=Quercus robur TaxID=38942 RepID=UPI002161EC80|nr:berberine bridge enzyme-like 4 [Quercus robur]
MKLSSSTLLIIFSALVLLVSCATSSPATDNFIQCLSNYSQPANPIFEAIYTPKNSSFPSVLLSYIRNKRFTTPTTPKPLAIVTAMHESHVQGTVLCAKNQGLQIRIRSGGHDYEGLSYVSYVPFVILDMFNLRSINISLADETAWVQAGATVGEVYYRIAEKSKEHGFSAAACHSVGTGGHFSGGGYGNMMRKYGLSVDNVIDAQIVNVNGIILDRKSMGEDLFWAIRGGGGASFGVILSWKIKLLRVPPIVTVFHANRTLEQGATDIAYQWQHVGHKLPEDLFIRVMPQVFNASQDSQRGKKTVVIAFIGLFLGQTQGLLSLLNESFPQLGLQQNECNEMSWVESTVFWADHPIGTSINVLLERPKQPVIYYKGRSDYVKEVIPKEVLESIWKLMIHGGIGWTQWNPYGGRMQEISESETPFPHRAGNLFLIQYGFNWLEDGIDVTNKNLNLSKALHDVMTPYVSKSPREAFFCYRDLDVGANSDNYTSFDKAKVYGVTYFKGNFERLVRVKTMVDPNNFFKNEQSIPPLPNYK